MRQFLGLQPTADPTRWQLPVTPGICGRRSVLYGSCALAAAVEAAEQATGRPLAWAACHFLRPAELGADVTLSVELAAEGRSFSHGRVVARLDDQRELFAVTVALGVGAASENRTWASMPTVPPPDQCPPSPLGADSSGRLRSRIDERWAVTAPESPDAPGRSAIWMRLPDGVPAAASALATLGDTVAVGTAAALGRDVQVPSLDNTIRVLRPVACDWVLAHVEVQGLARGLAHGTVNLWSPTGELLAVTAQTGVVVVPDSQR